MSDILSWLPYLRGGAIGFLVFCIISSLISAIFFRRARVGQYYLLREAARQKALWWLLASLIALLLGLILFFLATNPLSPLGTIAAPSPTPTLSATATLVPIDTATPAPTATPTRRPTATPPFIPSSTPTPTPTPFYPLPETALTPQPSAVPAGPEAQIDFLTFAMDEDSGTPVDPGDAFPPGDHRVYLFFEYRGMAPDVVWTYGWYREGEYLDGATRLWVLNGAGTTYLYFKPPAGYEPGRYAVRIWIEGVYQGVAEFTIAAE